MSSTQSIQYRGLVVKHHLLLGRVYIYRNGIMWFAMLDGFGVSAAMDVIDSTQQ